MKKLLLLFILFLSGCTITIEPLVVEQDTKIDVGSPEPDWEEFIKDFGLDGLVGSYVNVNVVGKYLIEYESNGQNNLIVVEVVDSSDPDIDLKGSTEIDLELGEEFLDPGVDTSDNYDENLEVRVDSNVDIQNIGEYTVKYTVYDSSGNSDEVIRTVKVTDTVNPIIELIGEAIVSIDLGTEYIDDGAVCSDYSTCQIEVEGIVDDGVSGSYEIIYTATDESGNKNSIKRTVEVIEETTEEINFDLVINKNLLDLSHKKVGYEMTPTYIVIHNTGNTASAYNEINYLHNTNNTSFTSFHFAVDENEVWQGMDTNYNAWHAGDGDGVNSYNRNSIGIEIAKSLTHDDETKDQATYNAAVLTARMMLEYNIPIENIITHYDASGKYCPHDIFDRYGFDRFKDLVQTIYDQIL
ncbi:DUF5011 domain-containing protein [Mycoplasmatota bacterium zrk1]